LPCERKEAEVEAVQATAAGKGRKRQDEGSHERVVAARGPTANKGHRGEEPTVAIRSARHDSLQGPSFSSVAAAAVPITPAADNTSHHQTPEEAGARYQQSYQQQLHLSSPINESSLPPAAVAVASPPSIKGTRSIIGGASSFSLPLTDSTSFSSSYSSPSSYLSFGAVTDYSPSSPTDPLVINSSYDAPRHHNNHQPCYPPIPLRDCDRAGDADKSLMGTEAPRLLVGVRAKEVDVSVGGNSGSRLNAAAGAPKAAADFLRGTYPTVRNSGVGVVAGGGKDDRDNLSWTSGGNIKIDSRHLGLPFSNADATPISTLQLPQKQTQDILGHASVSQPQQISSIVTSSTTTTATSPGNIITQRSPPSHHQPHSGTAIPSDEGERRSMDNININDASAGSVVAVEDGLQEASGPLDPTLSSPLIFQYPASQPTRPRDSSVQGPLHNGSSFVGVPSFPVMSNQNNHAHINHNNPQACDDNNSNFNNSQNYTSGAQFASCDDIGRNDCQSLLPSTKSPFALSPVVTGGTTLKSNNNNSDNGLSEVSTSSIFQSDVSLLSRRERALDSPSKGYGIGALGQSEMSLPEPHGQGKKWIHLLFPTLCLFFLDYENLRGLNLAEKHITPQAESKGMSMGMGTGRQRVDSSSITKNAAPSWEEKARPDAGLIRPVPLRIQEGESASFMNSPAGDSQEPSLPVGGNGGPLSPATTTTINHGFSS
jgi:hypothetical protein